MAIKNITYQRLLNLGDYNSKRLEVSAEIFEFDDANEETSRLMEMVERKIREDVSAKIEEEIRQLKAELRDLKKEYEAVKSSLLTLTTTEEADSDDVPFAQISEAQLDEINKYF